MTQTNLNKRFADAVSTAPASSKRFAFKSAIALAVEHLLVQQMVGVMHVTDAPPREPEGHYAAIALRLTYQRDMNMVRMAMASAPVDDSAAMINRMMWLASRKRTGAPEVFTPDAV